MKTIKELVKECSESAAGIRSNDTIKTYATGMKLFMDHIGSKEVLVVDDFIEFVSWLPTLGYAKRTMEVYYAGVKYFLDFLLINGHIDASYSQMLRLQQNIRLIKRKREIKLPRFPEKDTPEKILAAIKQIDYRSPIKERNIAIISFMISTGCRNNEICKMKISDINLGDSSAIVTGKGRERRVYFDTNTNNAINQYFLVRGNVNQNDPVFLRHDAGVGSRIEPITSTSIRNIFKEAVILSGVDPKTSPHYMRHAFAIKMLNGTKNLSIVQDLLGHASPQSTRVYAKIRSDDLESTYREVFDN